MNFQQLLFLTSPLRWIFFFFGKRDATYFKSWFSRSKIKATYIFLVSLFCSLSYMVKTWWSGDPITDKNPILRQRRAKLHKNTQKLGRRRTKMCKNVPKIWCGDAHYKMDYWWRHGLFPFMLLVLLTICTTRNCIEPFKNVERWMSDRLMNKQHLTLSLQVWLPSQSCMSKSPYSILLGLVT